MPRMQARAQDSLVGLYKERACALADYEGFVKAPAHKMRRAHKAGQRLANLAMAWHYGVNAESKRNERETQMDINECLKEIRILTARRNNDPASFDSFDAAALCELVDGLDLWLSKGGFLPDEWQVP